MGFCLHSNSVYLTVLIFHETEYVVVHTYTMTSMPDKFKYYVLRGDYI